MLARNSMQCRCGFRVICGSIEAFEWMSAAKIRCIDDVKTKGGQRCRAATAATGRKKAKARQDRRRAEHACRWVCIQIRVLHWNACDTEKRAEGADYGVFKRNNVVAAREKLWKEQTQICVFIIFSSISSLSLINSCCCCCCCTLATAPRARKLQNVTPASACQQLYYSCGPNTWPENGMNTAQPAVPGLS